MASNRSEYQDYFLGGKGGQCVGLTILPPSHAGSLEIWGPQPAGTLLGLSVPVHDLFYFFLLYLRTNREFCPKQRSVIGVTTDMVSVYWAVNWVFKYKELRFVLRGLNTMGCLLVRKNTIVARHP